MALSILRISMTSLKRILIKKNPKSDSKIMLLLEILHIKIYSLIDYHPCHIKKKL